MALEYGVLRGKVDSFNREDDDSSPHLQIHVRAGQGLWRVPVNVLSGDGSLLIFHRADPLQSHPILAGLSAVAAGFTLLPPASRSATTALDFFRAPLFDWPNGVAIPPTGPGADDDLQDAISAYLTLLKAQGGDLFAFGAKFPEPGVHDVHMNQGNPSPGSFAKDNGVFQDGGLILSFTNRFVGLFFRFKTQWLPTDNATGHRSSGAHEIPAGGSPGGPGTPPAPTPPVGNPEIYIERALVNPGGNDPTKEVVVIGNTTTLSVDLTGWSVVDKNNNAEVLAGVVLPPGESRKIVLSGNTAQLANKGGTIRLKNPAGDQVHAVSYSKEDANREDRYIRFNT